ncbi:Fe(3+) ABC transporter substrate-binding protein [Magnetofaba australis]|nr:Fe(3+) ABC transporter substrate-binding protein [Magnetofaba australis]
MPWTIRLVAFSLISLISLGASAALAAEVNLYSARKEQLIKPLLDRFTAETGIRVNLVTGKADALLKRLKSEGINSPADVLLTTDAGRLHRAKQVGVTQAVNDPELKAAIPSAYRDPEGHWFGLSLRARPILYVKGQVDATKLSSYEQLADPMWRGRICIRSSGNIYNQSLVASMIAVNGVQATEQWAKQFVKNFARPPRGGDRDQIKGAASGQCDIAIANTYYLAGMLLSKDPNERSAAQRMVVFWPNQEDRGTHVNVSGAAVTRSAKHVDEAVKLIRFLTTPEAQAWYSQTNGEYPVRSDAPVSALLKSWGDFKADTLNLSQLGLRNPDAVMLMDRAGWK